MSRASVDRLCFIVGYKLLMIFGPVRFLIKCHLDPLGMQGAGQCVVFPLLPSLPKGKKTPLSKTALQPPRPHSRKLGFKLSHGFHSCLS